jgi:hypothetical protein
VLLIFLASAQSVGQSSEVWLDYFALWPAGSEWTFEANTGFAKGVTDPKWLDAYLSGNATFQPFNWFNTEGNFETHYTFNTTEEDILELRPWLGVSLIWATYGGPLRLFYPFLSVRLEERLFWYQTSGAKETKERLRLRMSARFCLNNDLLTEGTYYLLFLAESFIPLDGSATEVSADRLRFQGGIGYVVGPDLRLELQYVLMRTRNTQMNTFEVSNNVVWFALRNHF